MFKVGERVEVRYVIFRFAFVNPALLDFLTESNERSGIFLCLQVKHGLRLILIGSQGRVHRLEVKFVLLLESPPEAVEVVEPEQDTYELEGWDEATDLLDGLDQGEREVSVLGVKRVKLDVYGVHDWYRCCLLRFSALGHPEGLIVFVEKTYDRFSLLKQDRIKGDGDVSISDVLNSKMTCLCK